MGKKELQNSVCVTKKREFLEFGTEFCLDVVEQENPGGNS